METLGAKDKNLIALTQKVDGLAKRFEALFAQADELTQKQLALDALNGKLGQLDELGKKTSWQMDSLRQSRQDLEVLRKDVQDLYKLHGDVAKVADKLGADRLKLEAVSALQSKLVPLVGQLNSLKTEIGTASERINGVKHDEATVAEQEKRFAELLASSKGVAGEVAERARQMQKLSEELARSTAVKEEMLAELDRVQSRQRDASSQIQASEDQLARAENMFKQLEQRRAQVAFGEKKLAAVELRLADIKQFSTELDRTLDSIANREQLVNAVKAEVDQVHQIAARSKADLE